MAQKMLDTIGQSDAIKHLSSLNSEESGKSLVKGAMAKVLTEGKLYRELEHFFEIHKMTNEEEKLDKVVSKILDYLVNFDVHLKKIYEALKEFLPEVAMFGVIYIKQMRPKFKSVDDFIDFAITSLSELTYEMFTKEFETLHDDIICPISKEDYNKLIEFLQKIFDMANEAVNAADTFKLPNNKRKREYADVGNPKKKPRRR